MSKKKRLTEKEQFEAWVDAADTSDVDGLIDPEDIPGLKMRKTHSKRFTDAELDAAPSYTPEEMAALPEPWTRRGAAVTEADKSVIRSVADKNKAAARIFVTGEVAEEFIGEAATRLLVNINDTLYGDGAGEEPLFVETDRDTVRMLRFDPVTVWPCFHPDILAGLLEREIARLGVRMDPWAMKEFDFYADMIRQIKKDTDGPVVPAVGREADINVFYNAAYLSCLLLFGKPGYMDVTVASHFADPQAASFMKAVKYRDLNLAEREKLETLRKEYEGVRALTNPEMSFIVDLHQKAAKQ